jgi:hypothetical protein
VVIKVVLVTKGRKGHKDLKVQKAPVVEQARKALKVLLVTVQPDQKDLLVTVQLARKVVLVTKVPKVLVVVLVIPDQKDPLVTKAALVTVRPDQKVVLVTKVVLATQGLRVALVTKVAKDLKDLLVTVRPDLKDLLVQVQLARKVVSVLLDLLDPLVHKEAKARKVVSVLLDLLDRVQRVILVQRVLKVILDLVQLARKDLLEIPGQKDLLVLVQKDLLEMPGQKDLLDRVQRVLLDGLVLVVVMGWPDQKVLLEVLQLVLKGKKEIAAQRVCQDPQGLVATVRIGLL